MQRTLGSRVFFLGVLLIASAAQAELAVPPQEATVLLHHLSIHSKNLTDEIAAINDTALPVRGGPFVVDRRVLQQMAMMDPYVNGLIRTTLLGVPPRPRTPIPRPRPFEFVGVPWPMFEFMVSWRMADLFYGSERSQTALKNLVSAAESGANPAPAKADFDQSMQQLINRYSIAVPATYIYIEALRRTYLVNPCATWPNAELPAILARLEAQVFVLRQNMDALFINPFFNPCFPRNWGLLESTFHGFRMDVAAQGPIGIAPLPYFREGARGQGFFQPSVQAVPRQGLAPALTYDPNQFGNQWDRFSPGYAQANGVQPGTPVQSFPTAVGGQQGLPDGLPQQGIQQPQGNNFPNGQPMDPSGANGQGMQNGFGPQQPVQTPGEVYGPQQLPQNQNAFGPQQPQYQNGFGQQQPQYQNGFGQQQPPYQDYYGPQQQQYQNYYGPQPLQNQNSFGQQQPQNQGFDGTPQYSNQGYFGGQQGGANGQPLLNNNDSGNFAGSPQTGGINNGDGTLWGWGDFGYPNAQQPQQRNR